MDTGAGIVAATVCNCSSASRCGQQYLIDERRAEIDRRSQGFAELKDVFVPRRFLGKRFILERLHWEDAGAELLFLGDHFLDRR